MAQEKNMTRLTLPAFAKLRALARGLERAGIRRSLGEGGYASAGETRRRNIIHPGPWPTEFHMRMAKAFERTEKIKNP